MHVSTSAHLLAAEPECSAADTDLEFFHYISLFLFHGSFLGGLLLLFTMYIVLKLKRTYFERTLERDIKVTSLSIVSQLNLFKLMVIIRHGKI